MRTRKSLINIFATVLQYAVVVLTSFFIRPLFISKLGIKFMGIEGSFTDIITALSIVELGLGAGMIYKLYKPIAENDWSLISTILCFFRKSFVVIAGIMFSLGLILSPFVGVLIKEEYSNFWLSCIFILFLTDTISSYLYSHKRAMIIADQKSFVNHLVHIVNSILMLVLQILVLHFYSSFEAFLAVRIFCRLLENFVISYIFDKTYPSINLKTTEQLPKFERKALFRNMKALFMHKVAHFGITAISGGVLILKFVSLRENGIYRNYSMIIMALLAISSQVFDGVGASFGNLMNTEEPDKVYSKFNVLYLMNFFIFSFITVSFFNLINPFIDLWVGSGLTFSLNIVIILTIYLYLYGIRQSVMMVKNSAGIYDPDKYFGVLGAIVSILISYALASRFGIAGILLGSIFGLMSFPLWGQPLLVYKIVFKKSVKFYHLKYLLYAMLTTVYTLITYMICSKIHVAGIIGFIIKTAICLIVPNVFNIILFYKSKEFKELLRYSKYTVSWLAKFLKPKSSK